MVGRNWTRSELILALNLYLKLPFGKLHQGNPDVIRLANLINRTPSSIAIRLTNFANVDPFHQARGIKGMSGGRAQVEPIWNEFIEDKERLLYESERILAEYEGKTLEDKFSFLFKDIESYIGEVRLSEVRVRVNQNIFRQIVMANYDNKCAISGIDISQLLIASHIVPWSSNEQERLNPENGICLSPLYDKAFDKGLITVDTDFKIVVSKRLAANTSKPYYAEYFSSLEGRRILIPRKYPPRSDFLIYHQNNIFID